MAYTNAIYHIDLVNGSDAARTALTACSALNPSGTITRIFKTAHGLTTGAVVDLTLFTAWLNSAWKITVVDADNFDLDDAVWIGAADNNGTVTPRGGVNWADAWKTINTGATAARHQAGDEIRIAKTEDPTSLGQTATFTDGSKTVTLTTAITKNIEYAESGWTASANITLLTDFSRKIGATSVRVSPSGAFTTGKVAYKAIHGGGTQDFSAFQQISFWMKPNSTAIAANTYRIALCSDATGDTIVNFFNVPALSASTNWHSISIDSGAALGASIQSVAIYAVIDPGTANFSINNLFAHNGFNLNTLFGPDGDCYYMPQNIDETTITIDSNETSSGGRGWSGSTGSYTIYKREPFKVQQTAAWSTFQNPGVSTTGYINYVFGWDTGSNIRDGETVVVNINRGATNPLVLKIITKMSNFVSAGFSGISVLFANIFENVSIINGAFALSADKMQLVTVKDCRFYNLSSLTGFGGQVEVINLKYFNNQSAMVCYGGTNINSSEFRNNGSNSISASSAESLGTGSIQLRNTLLSDSGEVSIGNTSIGTHLWSYNHDNTPGNNVGFTFGATIIWQTTVKQGSDPGSWATNVTNAGRNQLFPVIVKVAEIACSAGSLVTVKVWMKKGHATNIGCSIYIRDEVFNVDGVVEMETLKTDDTSWEELTLTFTPSVSGVVPIWSKHWYVAGSPTNTYIGSITATQA